MASSIVILRGSALNVNFFIHFAVVEEALLSTEVFSTGHAVLVPFYFSEVNGRIWCIQGPVDIYIYLVCS